MAKQDNTIFWVIGIAIFLFLILPNIQKQKQNDEGIGLSVHYYDSYGNEILQNTRNDFLIIPEEGIINDLKRQQRNDKTYNMPAHIWTLEELAEDKEDDKKEIFSFSIFKNLISSIKSFSITTSTSTFTLPLTYARTYTKDYTDGSYDYYSNDIYQIGSNQKTHSDGTTDPDVNNAIMRFSTASLPSNLISSSQITRVVLAYKIHNVLDDENDGVSTDIAVMNDLSSSLPSSSTMWNNLEIVSGLGGILHRISESEEETWINRDLPNAASEIMERDTLDVGIEGELDVSNDEYATIYSLGSIYAPYVTVTYTYTQCVPETCTSLGKQCGSWPDGCGGTLNCGTPPSGYTCTADGQLQQTITSISFEVTATNTGDATFTDLKIFSATPTAFFNALPTATYTLSKGASQKFTSVKFLVDPVWTSQTVFEACVSGLNPYTNQAEIKCASKSGVL